MSFEINLELIRKTREARGVTQTSMAKALGLAGAEKYNRREKGGYKFKATEIPLVAKELEIPYEKIFVQSLRKPK